MTYPADFPVPLDKGGPGAGQPIGGFGGNQAADRAAHREAVARLGKTPVLLVHGNGGAADIRPWDLLDQQRFLLAAGYTDELIWAPSYLAQGAVDLLTPHTNNVDDLRDYLEAVGEYLGVDVVDVIAHSLGCSLMYSVCRGLQAQSAPATWNQPKKWNRLGTFVALAGAFHGLGAGSIGEWRTGGEFIDELLAETEGGGGETPFGPGKPPTPGPMPHTVTYFCGSAAGDFVDAQNPGTGLLDGAVNRSYDLGSGQQGHQAIKESQTVFNEFLPLLNAVPPAPRANIGVDVGSGSYPSPLTVTVSVIPAELVIDVIAARGTKQVVDGAIVATKVEERTETFIGSGSFTLDAAGVWEVTVMAPGASVPLSRTYWVDVAQLVTSITTDSSTPFEGNVEVTAAASEPTATLYYSVDGQTWSAGAAVEIDQDAVVSFVAITPDGNSSAVASATFTKRVSWDDAITADAVTHFIAGRIDVNSYLAYSDQFGSFTPFTLYLVNGEWVLDPQQPVGIELTTDEVAAINNRADQVRPQIRLARSQSLTEPTGLVSAQRTMTIEAPADGEQITVRYTRDGSIPGMASDSFVGRATFELGTDHNQVIACFATDGHGAVNYRAFPIAGSTSFEECSVTT